jgi:hypothetical protein
MLTDSRMNVIRSPIRCDEEWRVFVNNEPRSGPASEEQGRPDAVAMLEQLLVLAHRQADPVGESRTTGEIDTCLLDKIAQIACMTANETHLNGKFLASIAESLASLLAMYRGVHADQALQLDRLAKVESELRECCPVDAPDDPVCCYEPCEPAGGIRRGDGYSTKSRGYIEPEQVSESHGRWTIKPHTLNEIESLPQVVQGSLVGPLSPSLSTPPALDFRSGSGPAPSGGQEPVTFRTFSESGVTTGVWPPDMSGAKSGDVVLMSGNLWLKLSVDGGKTFADVKFTDVFAQEKTYGGWAGDQVIHYAPQIDCFVLYVQSKAGAKGGANASRSVVKVALASPADLKKFKGGKAAWRRQWHFTSDNFGLNAWLDFPDLSFGDSWLYINTNTFTRTYDSAGKSKDVFAGRLFFELPLKELSAGTGFTYWYGLITDPLVYGSPTQNIGDENYWAAHVDNSTMRIYSSKGSESDYHWRERKLGANWPMAAVDKNNVRDIISAAPDSGDWLSDDHRIIGATRVNNQVWFAWTAAPGDGGAGGFKFPQAHIQIAKFDLAQDYKFVEQSQVWNAEHAYAYPSLTTNSNNEVGISLAWGGGKYYGSHAVGILGDFVVWYGRASQLTSTIVSPTRFGDYLHVRLAHPDTRFFGAFGYSVLDKPTSTPPETADYLYVEFGREAIALPGPR